VAYRVITPWGPRGGERELGIWSPPPGSLKEIRNEENEDILKILINNN
jgi:hypothetical protein